MRLSPEMGRGLFSVVLTAVAWASFMVDPAVAAPPLITGISIAGDGTATIEHSSSTNDYYTLLSRTNLSSAASPVDMELGGDAAGLLSQAATGITARAFLHVTGRALSNPADTDQDGLNDLYELINRNLLNPLDRTDANRAPSLSLNLPFDTTRATLVAVEGTALPTSQVVIVGGALSVTGVTDVAGNFFVDVPLRTNRLNRLFASSDRLDGSKGFQTPVEIVQDSEAPFLFIDFPEDGAVLTTEATVIAGRVGDMLSGFMGLDVTVNGAPANVIVGIGQNGTFERGGVPLVLGTNVITATASDVHGNSITQSIAIVREELSGAQMVAVSGDSQRTNIQGRASDPLVVAVTHPNGSPFVGKIVTFDVTRSNGSLFDAASSTNGARMVQRVTDAAGQVQVWWRLGSDAGCGNNRVSVRSQDISGSVFFCASADPAPARQINIGSGNNQRSEAGGPALQDLKAWVNDTCNGVPGVPVTFTVIQGGGKVNGEDAVTVDTSITGHAAVSCTLGPDGGNNIIKADFAGNLGRPATFMLFGVVRNLDVPTSFSGLVLNNANQPLGGARCFLEIEGQAFPEVHTDVAGQFVIRDIPAGFAHLHIDGLSVTTSDGAPISAGSYPALAYETVIVPNAANTLATPVLLPPLDPINARAYDGTLDVELTVAGMEGLRMIVKAGSMTRADGSVPSPADPAVLALNQVHHDDVPMPMPDGAAPPFAWTLQPAGATFDPPIEIHYPNMSALPPGAIAYFLSFNHDTEQFNIVATGAVSEDGSEIVTDSGVGLSVAGWGCNCPPYSVTSDCCREPSSGCMVCEDEKLVNAPDGTPSDDANPCTVNDVCKNGLPLGEVPGFPPCSSAEPEFVIDYTEEDEADGGNFARLEDVIFEGAVCYDADSRSFKYNVNSVGYRGIINVTQAMPEGRPPSIEPNPVEGGNVTAENYCAMIADLRNPSRGVYNILESSRIHEEYHMEVDYKRLMNIDLPGALEEIKAISVACDSPFGLASASGYAERQAKSIVCDFEADFSRRRDKFHKTHNKPPLNDGAYQASEPINNLRVRQIELLSIILEFPPCPSGLVGPTAFDDVPFASLTNLTATASQTQFSPGETAQIMVEGSYADGSTSNLTAGALGTTYRSGNPAVATVSADGLITAVAPGYVNIIASHSPGFDYQRLESVVQLVIPFPDDRDADLMLDAWEDMFGFDPDDPTDADLDGDFDNLSNVQEFLRATDPTRFDTDGDGLSDGLEVENGEDPRRVPRLSEQWMVKVGAQTVSVNPDGSFRIPNVSAPDLFGPGGPGTRPDFLSDDFSRLVGQRAYLGVTHYVFSDPFLFSQGQTFLFTNLTYTSFPPPLPASIVAFPDIPTLTSTGQTTQVRVTATLGDGSMLDVTPRTTWTTYRTSNPAIATIDRDGLVTAHARGIVFITALNEGATAVTQVNVSPGDPLTTLTGFVQDEAGNPVSNATINVAGLGASSLTDANGMFSVSGVPTLLGPVRAVAYTLGGISRFGNTASLSPVPSGLTDAGIITLTEAVGWVSNSSGDWNEPTNWSTGTVPGPDDNVFISAPPNVVVTHSIGTTTIASLYTDNRLEVIGGILSGPSVFLLNEKLNLNGGTLANVTIIALSPAGVVGASTSSNQSQLDGVTVNGDIDLAPGILRLRNGLTLNGTLRMGPSGSTSLGIEGDQTIDGSGEILFEASASVRYIEGVNAAGQTWTVGSGITLRGGRAILGGSFTFGRALSIINQGAIIADVSGRTLQFDGRGGSLQNDGGVLRVSAGTMDLDNLSGTQGTLEVLGGHLDLAGTYVLDQTLDVSPGSTLSLGGSWSNLVSITASNATVNLGGTFNRAALGNLVRTGGTVNITGTMDNQGTTLALDAASGDYRLHGGTILGGTVTTTARGKLTVSNNSNQSRLDGVTVNGDIDLAPGILRLRNGLTLNGTLRMGPSGSTSLGIEGDQTIDGSGEILFEASASVRYIEGVNAAGQTWTVGSGITLRGGRAILGGSFTFGRALSIINQGAIIADVSGRTLQFDGRGGSLQNDGGVLRVSAGTMDLDNLSGTQGTLEVLGGHLDLAGTYVLDQTLSVSPGSTLSLGGSWSNLVSITASNATVNLGGTFNRAALGNLVRTGGTVNITGTMDNQGTTLALDAASGDYRLHGGTILGGTVTTTAGGKLTVSNNSNQSRLDGVTVNGDIDLAPGILRLRNGLTLNGTLRMGPSGSTSLGIEGDQTIDGSGEILFEASASVRYIEGVNAAGQTWTVGSGITLRGGRAILGGSFTFGRALSIINQGAIIADVSGRTLQFDGRGGSLQNDGGVLRVSAGTMDLDNLSGTQGTLEVLGGHLDLAGTYVLDQTLDVSPGSTLSLGGSWSNLVSITASNATVNLGGTFNRAALGNLVRTGGTVNITGTMDNQGTTLALDAASGDYRLHGGTILGGTVTTTAGGKLTVSNSGNQSRLDGVTVNGDIDLAPGILRLRNGLTLNGTLRMGPSGSTSLGIEGDQTIDGSGEILFEASASVRYIEGVNAAGQTWTVGSGITLRGGRAILGGSFTFGRALSIINQGAIIADVSGRTLQFDGRGGSLQNDGGVLRVSAGTMDLDNLSGTQGTLEVLGGHLDLAGTYVLDQTLDVSPGSTLSLGGSWSNLVSITASNATVNLGGTFDRAALGNLVRTGGTVNITGTMDNQGTTLALDAASGDYRLHGGTILGGTVTTTAGGKLTVSNSGNQSRLDGVTVNGDIDLAPGILRLRNGLTLNGTLRMGPSGSTSLGIEGDQTIDGSGEILFEASASVRYIEGVNAAGQTWTVGSGITLRGGRAILGGSFTFGRALSIINQGAIIADVNGQSLEFDGRGGTFTNEGTTQEINGGILILP